MAIVPDDELTDRNLGAMQQIVARNGPLVVITHPGVDVGELDVPASWCRRTSANSTRSC